MLKLQSRPTLEGSEPLFGDEIYKTDLGRPLSYSKGLCWTLGQSPNTLLAVLRHHPTRKRCTPGRLRATSSSS
ncbi:hypothetical protein E5676_scaffold313G003010 [Cucumis melo var. makuwa]|uniref:Uncharacterized protein n=1 Tax=Cucumis melo var. makuwa TaxID=1194695 RepID=A0A5D3DSB9_CUCMM|nr:hypothetical protein E5676_scaffold313G003010 [Cucumis melo var. makuwa]